MNIMTRLAIATCLLLLLAPGIVNAENTQRPPNFVVIFCDDLGYGDLGCYGHPTIRTPHLDKMAEEGMKLTQFYSASPVCTPSRAALMTGRLPGRNGMCSNSRRVLFPDSKGGLQASEITIATALKKKNYTTACIGKWHLGHLKQYLPLAHGFDEYFGIPYSNDMDRIAAAPRGRASFDKPEVKYFNVPLLRGNDIIQRPADQTTITRRYTEEAVQFITRNKQNPFFLYMPHSMPHIPLFRSPAFADKSRRGLYGDVIEEIDWSVGQVLETLRKEDLASNTLVFFTSDNGPWLIFGTQGGSAGLLRGGKGSTWEGGMREPTLAWQPGKIAAGSVRTDIASTMDIYATIHHLAGVELPTDRTLDSHNLAPVLYNKGKSTREMLYYYRGYKLMAVRDGVWKAHFMTQDGYGQRTPKEHQTPLLFNLEHDPSEKHNVANQHPEVLQRIKQRVEIHRKAFKAAPSQLEIR